MVITEVTPVLITDPKKRKELRDQMCAEYKRLTGVEVKIMEIVRPMPQYIPSARKYLISISCKYLQVDEKEVLGKSRKMHLVKCRQMAVYLLYKMRVKVEEIKRIMNYVDHASISHAVETVKGYLKVDKNYKEEYDKYKTHCLAELENYIGTNHPNKRILDKEQVKAIMYSIQKGGISHKELADIYQVSTTTISNIRNGKGCYKRNKK